MAALPDIDVTGRTVTRMTHLTACVPLAVQRSLAHNLTGGCFGRAALDLERALATAAAARDQRVAQLARSRMTRGHTLVLAFRARLLRLTRPPEQKWAIE